MDLIYMNQSKEDLGVLLDYDLDLAFGKDENDFECRVHSNSHCCQPGYYLYIEGTEYGGIIDGIKSDTGNNEVIYFGRTWQGILAGSVIKPEPGYDHYTVSGDGNAVLAQLISYLGLADIFRAKEEPSDIEIGTYSFRYVDGYSGILKMLATFNGKLKMEYRDGFVFLSAVYLSDYSKDEAWDATQIDFTVKKNFRPMNHLVCLGSGNMKDRYVIHLFADENGGIRPYKKVAQPVSDDDYILGTANQVLKGVAEVAEVYDYPSAQTVENYVTLTRQPSDWSTRYERYYKRNSEENTYESVTGTPDVIHVLQTAQPDDWETKYANYFTMTNGTAKAVEGEPTETYRIMRIMPYDWETTYGNYYVYYSDGLTEEYRKATGSTYYTYEVQTMKPSDWETNYNSYFERSQDGGMVKVGSGSSTCPNWVSGKYYTEVSTTYAPTWSDDETYYQKVGDGVPAWEANKYYTKVSTTVAPEWSDEITCYKKETKNGVESFTALTAKPSDWEEKYSSYYYIYFDGTTEKYKKVQGVTSTSYQVQTSAPSDWETNYTNYYVADSSGTYKKVTESYSYVVVDSKPSDWDESFDEYYTAYTDGISVDYKRVQGYTETDYQIQTQVPTDWKSNYSRYYEMDSWGLFVKVSGIPKSRPDWEPKKYFTQVSHSTAPDWGKTRYYECVKETVAPAWASGTYYTAQDTIIKPPFTSGVYFEKKIDHYAELVKGGIEKMEDAFNCNSIAVELNLDGEYDIGDIVGASEHITAISVWQPITKKIVTIKNGRITLSYEVGA